MNNVVQFSKNLHVNEQLSRLSEKTFKLLNSLEKSKMIKRKETDKVDKRAPHS